MRNICLKLLPCNISGRKPSKNYVNFERKICLNDMQYLFLCYGQLAMSALLVGFGFAFSMLDFIRDYLPQPREYRILKGIWYWRCLSFLFATWAVFSWVFISRSEHRVYSSSFWIFLKPVFLAACSCWLFFTICRMYPIQGCY